MRLGVVPSVIAAERKCAVGVPGKVYRCIFLIFFPLLSPSFSLIPSLTLYHSLSLTLFLTPSPSLSLSPPIYPSRSLTIAIIIVISFRPGVRVANRSNRGRSEPVI